MKLEEALERIVTLEAQLKEESEKYNALEAIKNDIENQNREKDERIQSLKESNMRFYEKLTQQQQEETQEIEPQEESYEAKDWDDFLSEL